MKTNNRTSFFIIALLTMTTIAPYDTAAAASSDAAAPYDDAAPHDGAGDSALFAAFQSFTREAASAVRHTANEVGRGAQEAYARTQIPHLRAKLQQLKFEKMLHILKANQGLLERARASGREIEITDVSENDEDSFYDRHGRFTEEPLLYFDDRTHAESELIGRWESPVGAQDRLQRTIDRVKSRGLQRPDAKRVAAAEVDFILQRTLSKIEEANENLKTVREEAEEAAKAAKRRTELVEKLAAKAAEDRITSETETKKAAIQQHMQGKTDLAKNEQNIAASEKRFNQIIRYLPTLIATLVVAYGASQGLHYLAKHGIERLFKQNISGIEETSLLSLWDRIRGVTLPASRASEMKFSAEFTKRVNDIFKAITLAMLRFKQNQPTNFKHYLFYGTPGTGKTMLAKEMARYAGMEYIVIRGAAFTALSEENAIASLLGIIDMARNSKKPVMLILDEAENLLLHREHPESDSRRKALTNAFLAAFAGAVDPHISVVLITNLPHLLDKALKSRIDTHIRFDLPDTETRRNMLEGYLYKFFKADEIDQSVLHGLPLLAELTKGFTGRRIELLVSNWKETLDLLESNPKILTADLARQVIDRKITDDLSEKEYTY